MNEGVGPQIREGRCVQADGPVVTLLPTAGRGV